MINRRKIIMYKKQVIFDKGINLHENLYNINLIYKIYENNKIYKKDIKEDTLYNAVQILKKELKKLKISLYYIIYCEVPIENVAIFYLRKKNKEIVVFTDENEYKFGVYDIKTCRNIEYKTLNECLRSEFQEQTRRIYDSDNRQDKLNKKESALFQLHKRKIKQWDKRCNSCLFKKGV